MSEVLSLLDEGRLEIAWDVRSSLVKPGDHAWAPQVAIDSRLLVAMVQAATAEARLVRSEFKRIKRAKAGTETRNLDAVASSSDDLGAAVAWVRRVAELWHTMMDADAMVGLTAAHGYRA